MALRAPPRAPPFTDYDELIEELSSQFNVFGPDGNRKDPPEKARSEWTEAEIQFWYASGGVIEPPDDPKMRAASAALAASADMRSPAQIEAENAVKEAQKAARTAAWFSKLTEKDIKKSDMYREVVLALGHPERPVGNLYPVDDELLRSLHKVKHYMPFEKHLLLWNDGADGIKKVLHPTEGATHGPSAALRGMDLRYFWDAASLKVVGTVRWSLAAVIGWRADEEESWSIDTVHGGMIEMCLDELTAEVMKINLAPENVTAEFTVRIKKPVKPNSTYKCEAEITECNPPTCMVLGRVTNSSDELIAECTAKMAMMDRLTASTVTNPREALGPPVTPYDAAQFSLAEVYKASGGGSAAPTATAPPIGGVGETVAELKRLQKQLVSQLQGEYFCDDVEPPAVAFGWDEEKLREYFENGGE